MNVAMRDNSLRSIAFDDVRGSDWRKKIWLTHISKYLKLALEQSRDSVMISVSA
jgi:hypothetical protein